MKSFRNIELPINIKGLSLNEINSFVTDNFEDSELAGIETVGDLIEFEANAFDDVYVEEIDNESNLEKKAILFGRYFRSQFIIAWLELKEPSAINDLVESDIDSFDANLLVIQNTLGITEGDNAGLYWSTASEKWNDISQDERLCIICSYLTQVNIPSLSYLKESFAGNETHDGFYDVIKSSIEEMKISYQEWVIDITHNGIICLTNKKNHSLHIYATPEWEGKYSLSLQANLCEEENLLQSIKDNFFNDKMTSEIAVKAYDVVLRSFIDSTLLLALQKEEIQQSNEYSF